MIRRLDSSAADFSVRLAELAVPMDDGDVAVADTVSQIIADVGGRGDEAVLDYTRRFDALDAQDMAELRIDRAVLEASLAALATPQRDALSAVYGFKGAREPQAAVQEIIAMPESPDKDFAINGFISGLAHQDGEAATIWAAEITQPAMRTEAVIRAGKHFYRQDEAAAAAWFATADLPEGSWERVTGVN